MTEEKHTPGPWKIVKDDMCSQIFANGESIMGDMTYYPWVPKNGYDWMLIAAAPELLDSHEPEREGPDFLDWVADRLVYKHGESENADFILCLRRRAEKARAAIAKATGK